MFEQPVVILEMLGWMPLLAGHRFGQNIKKLLSCVLCMLEYVDMHFVNIGHHCYLIFTL